MSFWIYRRRWLAGIAAVTLPLIGIIIAAAINHEMGRRRVDAELARIRAAGEPVDAHDLEVLYDRPADRDATALWLEALKPLDTADYYTESQELPIVGLDRSAPPKPGDPWGDLVEVEVFLNDHERSLAGMREAADLGGAARYEIEFHLGQAALLPHLRDIRAGMRLLLLEAHVRYFAATRRGAPKRFTSRIASWSRWRTNPISSANSRESHVTSRSLTNCVRCCPAPSGRTTNWRQYRRICGR